MNQNIQTSKSSILLIPNKTILRNRWRILFKLGEGAFGETYVAHDVLLGTQVAVKLESPTCSKPLLRVEAHILRRLQGKNLEKGIYKLIHTILHDLLYYMIDSPYVCRYLGCGKNTDNISYMVMQLQGQNLSVIRKQMANQKLTISSTALLGIHMINAIESIHERGFLHRDIKPANFVLSLHKDGYDGRRKCFIIDFGLARQFTTDKGEIRPPRHKAGFRGTARYASLNSHRCEELSRRDDMWSLFYVLVEFAIGKLPWSREKEKDTIALQKEKWMNDTLIADLPMNFKLFFDHIRKLNYIDRPDYSYHREHLHSRVRNSMSAVNSVANLHVVDYNRKSCISEDSKITLTDNALKTEHSVVIVPQPTLEKNPRCELFTETTTFIDFQPLNIVQEAKIPNDRFVTESNRTLTASIELKHFQLEGLTSCSVTDNEDDEPIEETLEFYRTHLIQPLVETHVSSSLFPFTSLQEPQLAQTHVFND
jgi:serine/threonine protein kinase